MVKVELCHEEFTMLDGTAILVVQVVSVRTRRIRLGYVPYAHIRINFGTSLRDLFWEPITYEEVARNCRVEPSIV